MADPRRSTISVGTVGVRPNDDNGRWEVSASADPSIVVAASWGEWVRLAKKILDTDALARDIEGRGDAWDLGHAAGAVDGSGGDTPNPFR